MTTPLDKVLYTARTHTTGGRDGRAVAQDLIDTAHRVRPYSNATRGNIEVGLRLA